MEAQERKPPSLKKRWQPKKWEPIYDAMVALSCTGLSNKAIAERFKYTPQQVSNILNSDQAKVIKGLVTKNIRDTAVEDNAARLTRLEQVALKNIEGVLTNSELLERNPLALYDRSLAFLKGTGKMEGEQPKNVQNTTNVMIGSDLVSKLISGIEKSNEAALMHGNAEVRKLPNGSTDSKGTEVSRKSA